MNRAGIIGVRLAALSRPTRSSLSLSCRGYAAAVSLFGKSAGLDVPLTEPLRDIPAPDTASYAKLPAPKLEVTTLKNGVRVASTETYGHVTTLGIYVDSGSRYENARNSGVSHVLEHMAFKSIGARSHFRTVREVEYQGGSTMAAASREQMVYQAEFLRTRLPYFMTLLADTVKNRDFDRTEFAEQMKALEQIVKETESNGQTLILEGLHAEAYRHVGLGMPLVCPGRNLSALTTDDLSDFMQQLYTPQRLVVAAAGVEHAALVDLAEKSLGSIPAPKEVPAKAASQYVGGEWRVHSNESPVTNIAIGFRGVAWADADLPAMCVLHTLMGGGNSFSAGGPGKGMYSRLYQNVLNPYHWVQSCTAFNLFYSDSGLFGIHATSAAADAASLGKVVVDELLRMKGQFNATEVARAKNQTKSAFLMNLESRSIVAEDIGRQLLIYGTRLSPQQLCASIDSVTPAHLQRLAGKILSSLPTLAVYGDTSAVPSYDVFASQLSS